MKNLLSPRNFALLLALLPSCSEQNDSSSEQSNQSQSSTASSYPPHLNTVEKRSAALAALPPGGSFTGAKFIGSCTYPNSTARVIFNKGTPDGLIKDFPPALKAHIQQKLTQEIGKTNFTISSFSDGTGKDYLTPEGAGIPGIITITMNTVTDAQKNSIHANTHGGAMNGSGGLEKNSPDGNCTGRAFGSLFVQEGHYTDGILMHELGHVLGFGHTENFRWRNRYLMPRFVSPFTIYSTLFLGSPDFSSVMAGADATSFSKGDVRALNFLYPTRGGKPREIHKFKPGTEVETGIMVVRGLEEKALVVEAETPNGSQQMPAKQGPLHSAVKQDKACVFSKATYFASNPDVKAAGKNAGEHYCKFGFAENRVVCKPNLRPNDKAVIASCEFWGGVMEPARGANSGQASSAQKAAGPLTWRSVEFQSDYDKMIRSIVPCPSDTAEGAACKVRGFACTRGNQSPLPGLVCAAPEDPLSRK